MTKKSLGIQWGIGGMILDDKKRKKIDTCEWREGKMGNVFYVKKIK